MRGTIIFLLMILCSVIYGQKGGLEASLNEKQALSLAKRFYSEIPDNDFGFSDGDEWMAATNMSNEFKQQYSSRFPFKQWFFLDMNGDGRQEAVFNIKYMDQGQVRYGVIVIDPDRGSYVVDQAEDLTFAELNQNPWYAFADTIGQQPVLKIVHWIPGFDTESVLPYQVDTVMKMKEENYVNYAAHPYAIGDLVTIHYEENFGMVSFNVHYNNKRNRWEYRIEEKDENGKLQYKIQGRLESDLMNDILQCISYLSPESKPRDVLSHGMYRLVLTYQDGHEVNYDNYGAVSDITLSSLYSWCARIISAARDSYYDAGSSRLDNLYNPWNNDFNF